MNLQEKQAQFARNVASLVAYIFSQGFTCTLGEAFRTKEQADIYAKQGIGIKDSLHCKRLAIDLDLFDNKQEYLTDSKHYQKFGQFWESLNTSNRWGGRFADANHFEMRDI